MPRLPAAAAAATAAAAARGVGGVVDLDAGPLGTRVTYGGSGRVAGVTVRDHAHGPGRTVCVHLRVAWGPLRATADVVRAAVGDALAAAHPDGGPWQVDVEVSDVESPAMASEVGR